MILTTLSSKSKESSDHIISKGLKSQAKQGEEQSDKPGQLAQWLCSSTKYCEVVGSILMEMSMIPIVGVG